jgi:hypothetical protein
MALLVAILGAVVVAPLSAAAQPTSTATFPVTGALDDGGTFTGEVTDLVFTNEGGVLTLTGTLTGTATDAVGTVTDITQAFTTTVDLTAGSTSCGILSLDLGPIFLDLLGLNVDLSPVTLDITAVTGSGNLLGNLLCVVVGLLDTPGGSGGLASVLNRLLMALG